LGIGIDPFDCVDAAGSLLSLAPSALFTDVDGTISQIAPRPEEGVVDQQVTTILSRFSSYLDLVAVVSGRSVSDLRSMIDMDGLTYVGNHGLEWWDNGRAVVLPAARPFLPKIAASMEYLQLHLDLPGLLFEDKGITGSVHYRLSPKPGEARKIILSVVAECQEARELRISEGRMVIDLLPPVRAGKGTAVRRLVRSHHLHAAVYLGDDATDLDAFRQLRAIRNSGQFDCMLIAVSSPEAPTDLLEEADCTLEGVEEVIAFLDATSTSLAEST
jgi:trehalose 6-phosphate phosphatase